MSLRQPVQFRQAAQTAPAAQPIQISFATDILPIFQPYQGQMMWRFDLTSYEAVMANAATIYSRISNPSSPMPPPPLPPLTPAQIQIFNLWMIQGCPP